MKYFVFCQSDLVLQKTGDSYQIPEEAPTELKPWTTVMDIDGAKAYRIDQPITNSDRYEMCGLRQSYYKLSEADYRLAGKCRELLYWDQSTKFCGVCGGTMHFDTPISKKCDQCGKEIWPLLAPAVIVLVRKGDEVLLVHANNFEAVYREVMEETGLHITNLRYFGSQPWPYPCGLMVGFTADYDGGKIHLQRSELSKGAWFDRNHLPHIPEKLSIARQLLDSWLERFASE